MRLSRIVTLDIAEHDLAPEDWAALGALAGEVVRARSDDPSLPAVLAGCDALLVQLGVEVGPRLLEAAPRLRYVGVFGTSTGRIHAEVARRGITVRNVPGFSTDAVAELAIAIVLDQLRDVSGARARALGGDLTEPRVLGRELRGRRVGVLGLGAIGRRVATILQHGFGADVRAWSRTTRPELVPCVALDALLAESEIVCVHLPLTPETRGLVHEGRIARLPADALLVSLAPLELFALPALIARLDAGTLRLATDHGDELAPADRHALAACARCALYPPIGYGTHEASAARRAGLVSALRAFVG